MSVNEHRVGQRVKRLLEYHKLDPGNWSLKADLFDAALLEGERAVARHLADESLETHPEDPAWLHRRALLALAEDRGAEAAAMLRSLLEAGHDVPSIRFNLGYALFKQRDWKGAQETVVSLLESQADGVAALALPLWLRCGHRLDRIEEALEVFRARVAAGGASDEAYGVASLMAVDAGAFDEAKEWSDRSLTGAPEQLEALVARASVLLGDLDAEGARRWFGEALRCSPSDGRSWSGLAFAMMLSGDMAGAGEAFQRAVQGMPDHVGTWIGMGWCHVLARKVPEAQAAFERALALDRNVAEAHGGLAVALAHAGAATRARGEIDVALRLDRASLSARYAEAVLSGEAQDLHAFQRLAKRLLAMHPAGGRARAGQTLADVVFGGSSKG